MTASPAARSYLLVSADADDGPAAGRGAGADEIVFDLHESVADDRKGAARDRLAASLDERRPVLVRINPARSRWFDDDLELCMHPGVTAVLLPLAEGIDPVCAVVERSFRDVIPVVESAAGIDALRAVAMVPGVVRLALDAGRLQAELGIEDADGVLPFRAQAVLASRLARLHAPIDGPSPDLDPRSLAARMQRARRLGFGATLCIDPRQVAAAHAAFGPRAPISVPPPDDSER